MKIFVGANQYGADFPELDKLRKKSITEGFHPHRHWINVVETLGDYSLQGKLAVLRGGLTGFCIAHVTDFMLAHDIGGVSIDLPNCRYGEEDLSDPKCLEKRFVDVMLGVKLEYRSDKRISFLPAVNFDLQEILTRERHLNN
jgi:hypothetical protein